MCYIWLDVASTVFPLFTPFFLCFSSSEEKAKGGKEKGTEDNAESKGAQTCHG